MSFSNQWLSVRCRQGCLRRCVMCLSALLVGVMTNTSECFAQKSENRIQFHDGNFRMSGSRDGQLIAELRSLKSIGGETFLATSAADKAVRFSDDGQGSDRVAKDGIYTGIVPGEIDAEIKRYKALVTQLQEDRPIPVFAALRKIKCAVFFQ
jgi:hypothetical protein